MTVPIGQTKIPLRQNRWVHFCIVFVVVIFHGAIIMNWTPLRAMLIRSGAYKWKCFPGDVMDADYTCGPQRESITLLGNLGQTMMFVGSAIAGVIADAFGPKICSTAGALLFVISYLMLGLSTESVQMYIPYALLNGLAIETSFFGLLTVPNLFPNNRGLMLSVLGSGRSLAMFYGLAMDKMTTEKFHIRSTAMVAMSISLFLGLVCFLCLPNQPYVLIDPMAAVPDVEQEAVSLTGDEVKLLSKEKQKKDFKDFLNRAADPFFICWIICFAFLYTRGSFYGLSVADQHRNVAGAFAIISPLSFIPCPLLGLMADYLGMMWVLLFLNTCGTIMFICLISGTAGAAEWIAVLLSCVVLSFLASQCYVFIQEQYKENVRGKLAGVSMCVAGLFALISTPIYNWSTRTNSFKGANGIFLGFSAGCYILLGIMWYLKNKRAKEATALISSDFVATKEVDMEVGSKSSHTIVQQ